MGVASVRVVAGERDAIDNRALGDVAEIVGPDARVDGNNVSIATDESGGSPGDNGLGVGQTISRQKESNAEGKTGELARGAMNHVKERRENLFNRALVKPSQS